VVKKKKSMSSSTAPSTLADKLTAQHGQIVDAIRSGRQVENRRTPRVEYRAKAQIYPCTNGQLSRAVDVQLQDFSHRGLCFHYKGQFNRGEQFLFKLPRADGGATSVLCTVAHCRRSSDDEYRIGAEFTCIVRTEGACIVPPTGDVERIRKSILG
jgi:hypothetical protein